MDVKRSPVVRACRWIPLLLLAGLPCGAQVWVGVGAGTRGAEVEISDQFAPLWGVQADIAGFSLGVNNLKVADNLYDASVHLLSGRGQLDFHPFANGFAISAGIIQDGNSASGHTVPIDGRVSLGTLRLPVALVGSLAAKVDYSPIAPALSLGWSSFGRHGFGGFVNAGAFYQGKPRVRLTLDLPQGSPLNNPATQPFLDAALAIEASRVEAKIDRYRVYPILDFGIGYRF
jgi:hypothetical protein